VNTVLQRLLADCGRPLALLLSGSPAGGGESHPGGGQSLPGGGESLSGGGLRALLRQLAPCCDAVIAADLGAAVATESGLAVDFLVGDMDSLPESMLRKLEQEHTTIVSYNPDKDQTDLDLALAFARKQGFAAAVIANWRGSRLDHELATLGAAAAHTAHFVGKKLLLASPGEAVLVMAAGAVLKVGACARIGQQISVLALWPDTVVSESGLKWELHQEQLEVLGARGISNLVERSDAAVRVDSGVAAVIFSLPSCTSPQLHVSP
jgi:thiamine pyrophosphokinase